LNFGRRFIVGAKLFALAGRQVTRSGISLVVRSFARFGAHKTVKNHKIDISSTKRSTKAIHVVVAVVAVCKGYDFCQ